MALLKDMLLRKSVGDGSRINMSKDAFSNLGGRYNYKCADMKL